jgi:hypothetical protein
MQDVVLGKYQSFTTPIFVQEAKRLQMTYRLIRLADLSEKLPHEQGVRK